MAGDGQKPGSSNRKTGGTMRHDAGTKEEGGTVDKRVQGEIGKQLRAVYEDVVNEPVPDRFVELLKKLERSTNAKN